MSEEFITQPSELKLNLKEHQKKIIASMTHFEKNGEIFINQPQYIINNTILYNTHIYNKSYIQHQIFDDTIGTNFKCKINYAILADMVGAGKTFEIIGLICHHKLIPNHSVQYAINCPCSLEYMDTTNVVKCTFIIIPHNLALQWKTAFEYTSLKYYFIISQKSIDNLHRIDGYDVICCTNTMFKKYIDKFNNIKYNRIVIDEICSIRLTSLRNIKANFTWYITATPYNITDIYIDQIRNQFVGLPLIILENIICKNNDEYVIKSMQIPPANEYIIKCKAPETLHMLKDHVSNDVLSMLNAGNYKEAIQNLNCNIATDENIIDVITKNYTIEIHNKKKELEFNEAKIMLNKTTKNAIIDKLNIEITQLNNKINSVKDLKDRIDIQKNIYCPICFDTYGDTVASVMPCCQQLLCMQCMLKVNGKCAYCRNDFDIQKTIAITNHSINTMCKKIILSKIDIVIKIILNKKNAKILLFSNHDQTFANLITKFDTYNIKYSKLSGSNDDITRKINDFKNEKINVLFLNAKLYGSGLNLQMATDIIIFHDLSNDLKKQVIGRAQRIGRILPLNIYQIYYDHEYKLINNDNMFDLTNSDNINIFDIHLTQHNNVLKNPSSTDNIKKRKSKKNNNILTNSSSYTNSSNDSIIDI